MKTTRSPREFVDALVRAAGAADARSAILLKAAEAIDRYRAQLGEPDFPLHVEALASFLGISLSQEPPTQSRDAELVPRAGGRVEIRVSSDRPETRRRFSIAHEISHTFFPDYEMKTWCRPDVRHRRRDNPEDLIEMLCDVGAAHLLMPDPWFGTDAARIKDAVDLIELATRFGVSREAAIRRYAEGHPDCCAAVFFSWKLKPAQQHTIGQRSQQRLFGDFDEEVARAKKLRVDYSIPNTVFAATGRFVPADKSVALDGVLYHAASTGRPVDGDCHLDLGAAAGRYRVLAVPVWTPDDGLGPEGENGVAAIILPLDLAARTQTAAGPRLFEHD
ncbi:MAG: ImmA/IrrE family metallo-endopeptidase [Acidobacteria bacterium]|nr:ImmA/IrrE family metallo-endopeptidase [Acidobacteriota bacterium]